MKGNSGFFRSTLAISALFAVLAILFPEPMAAATGGVTAFANHHFDWVLSICFGAFLILVIGMALSPFGKIRLGAPGEKPEFSTLSWLAMMFAAGMGAGLLFFGVAGPMNHFMNPLSGEVSESAMIPALSITMFHWGLHAWGIYCVAGLVIAYFAFRRHQPYLAGSPLRDVFTGRWVEPVAKASDFLAVIAVVFGLGVSISIGAMQVHSGLSRTFGLPEESLFVGLTVLWLIVAAYIASATTSLSKGVKWLSNINVMLMFGLMTAVFFIGPSRMLAMTAFETLANYLVDLPAMMTRQNAFTADQAFYESWSLTYFVWWASWAPFVGIFVARISRGRTLREFVTGVLLAPTLFSVVSFAIFGGSAMHEELTGSGGLAQLAVQDEAMALFELLSRLPFAGVLSIVASTTVFIFVVTSGDSGTFVLGMLTSGGSNNPPKQMKVAWGVAIGLLATAFIIAGDVQVITAMAMSAAIPFVIVLALQAAALVRAVWDDAQSGVYSDAPKPLRRPKSRVPSRKSEPVGAESVSRDAVTTDS